MLIGITSTSAFEQNQDDISYDMRQSLFSSLEESVKVPFLPEPNQYLYELTSFLRSSKKGRSVTLHPEFFENKYHFTLAPEFEVVGPKLTYEQGMDPGQAAAQSPEYFQTVFRAIVKSAHKHAKDFYSEGDENYTYFAFMVLALATPHHESKLNHFRTVRGELCTPKTNSLEVYFTSSHGNKYETGRFFKEMFKNPYNNFIPDCTDIPSGNVSTQVLTSTNYKDFGIMQINTISHKEDFMQPEDTFNLYNTIDNGVHYLWNMKGHYGGFSRLQRRISKNDQVSCSHGYDWRNQPFENTRGLKMRSSYLYNLVRGSWAGYYNMGAGKQEQVCRFTNPGHATYENDVKFKLSLDSLVMHDTSIFHQYLPEDSVERLALQEIVHNFRSIYTQRVEDEKSDYLKMILASSIDGETQNVDLDYHKYRKTHTTNSRQIHAYSGPSRTAKDGSSNQCGLIINTIYPSPLDIEVVDVIYDEKSGREWSKVHLPKYSNLFVSEEQHSIVQKPSRYNVTPNLRTAAKGGDRFVFGQYTEAMRKQYPRLPIIAKENEFYKVLLSGRELWVHSVNFQVAPEDPNNQQESKCLTSGEYFVESTYLDKLDQRPIGEIVAKQKSKVRRYPTRNSTKITTLNMNETSSVVYALRTVERDGYQWYKIQSDNFEGWLREDRIQEIIEYKQQQAEPFLPLNTINEEAG